MSEERRETSEPDRSGTICGFNDRIAHVHLADGAVRIEHPGEAFFRTYLGGSAVGAYYLLKEMPAGADPLGPENVLVVAPSVLTGAPISGLSRFNLSAKSPLTGCIGDSQCGGFFGPQLKYAGFDALVIKGAAEQPCYLWVHDDEVEVRDASHLEALFPAELEQAVKNELGDQRAEVLQNGPAGRRLVRFACAGNRMHHFAGRTGMGAVMGSKNLVAVVARGKRRYPYFDEAAVKGFAPRAKAAYAAAGFEEFTALGTSNSIEWSRDIGGLITRNLSRGVFAGVEQVDSTAYHARVVEKPGTCFSCIVRCKRVVKGGGCYDLDPAYGGPEFETIGMFGPNCGIDDIEAIAKANQLCDAYGLDTIQTGGLIAFLMECCEQGLVATNLLDGLEPRFGDAEALLELVRRIGEREGIGDLLAEGFDACVVAFGPEAAEYAMHVKGLAIPAHMPQVKQTFALMYAVNPFGADHMSCGEDDRIDALTEDDEALDLHRASPWGVLDEAKTRYVVRTEYLASLIDSLELCSFCFSPGALWSFTDLVDMLQAVNGFSTSMWSLLKTGERRVALMRAFNAREGVGTAADVLPERAFAPLPEGLAEGACVERAAFARARAEYYAMAGIDPESGGPLPGQLLELDLAWVDDLLTTDA